MRRILPIATLVVSCFVLLSVARGDEPAKPAAPTSLEGDWKTVNINSNNADVPKEEIDKMQMTISFAGDKYTLAGAGGPMQKGAFSVNDGKTPKEIGLTPSDGPAVAGIYDVDGDTLRICTKNGPHMAERPTEIKPAQGIDIVTFRKVAKP